MSRINLAANRKLRQDPTHTYVYLTANHAMSRAPMTVIVGDDLANHNVDLPSDAVGGDLLWVRPRNTENIELTAPFGQTIEGSPTFTCTRSESWLFVYVDAVFDWIRLVQQSV